MSATCRCCLINPPISPCINQIHWSEKTTKWLFGALKKFSKANLPAGLTHFNQQQTIIFSPTQTHTRLYVCVQHTASQPAAIDRCGWCLLLRSDWLPTVFTLLGLQQKLEWNGDGIHVHSRLRLRPVLWWRQYFAIRCVHAQQLGEYSCLHVHQRILHKPDMFTTSGQERCFGPFCGKIPRATQENELLCHLDLFSVLFFTTISSQNFTCSTMEDEK